MSPAAGNAEACRSLVEAEDPDRAVSLVFAPPAARDALAALYAFNVETARVRDQIRQPLTGEIRLQWWRDRILEPAAGPEADAGAGPPVASALLGAIAAHDLPRDAFDRFLEARLFDLYDDPMGPRDAFEAYAGSTACALIMLAAMVLGRAEASGAAEAAGHAGVAQLAAGVLRLLPIHRARGQVFIPSDILAAAGCTPDALLREDAAPTGRAVDAMAAYGQDHFGRYRALAKTLPRAVRPAFLPASLSAHYLDGVERPGAGGGGAARRINPFRRSWTYWREMRR